jgi:hypothetical protein
MILLYQRLECIDLGPEISHFGTHKKFGFSLSSSSWLDINIKHPCNALAH